MSTCNSKIHYSKKGYILFRIIRKSREVIEMLRYDLYLHKTVRIRFKNGRIYEGYVDTIENEWESSSGERELWIEKPFGILEPVALSEIDTIDIIEDKK